MVQTVERIDRELAKLDQQGIQLGDELYVAYQSYLTVFGQALRQQFILAVHHICTQVYPQTFLQLTFNQRQTLQQTLIDLVKRTQQNLLSSLPHPTQEVSVTESEDKSDLSSLSSEPSTIPFLTSMRAMQHSMNAALPINPEGDQKPSKLKQISQWFEKQEHRLTEGLRQLSWDANHALQHANILPPKLPEPLLEMTFKAELLSEVPTSGVPNILDVTLDALQTQIQRGEEEPTRLSREEMENTSTQTEGKVSSEEPEMTKPHGLEDLLPLLRKLPIRFVALHLNLTDIEFSDPISATHRTQVRQMMQRLSQLERLYHQKLQERAVVAAEDAWRASWFES